jgi:hypothetical protein
MTQMIPMSSDTHSPGIGHKVVRVPEWVYYFTDEQFVTWCKQHKLTICNGVRPFTEEERASIFRYMVRQKLVN